MTYNWQREGWPDFQYDLGEMQNLVEKGVFIAAGGGRSTCYRINL